jgi:hypothetical protein
VVPIAGRGVDRIRAAPVSDNDQSLNSLGVRLVARTAGECFCVFTKSARVDMRLGKHNSKGIYAYRHYRPS